MLSYGPNSGLGNKMNIKRLLAVCVVVWVTMPWAAGSQLINEPDQILWSADFDLLDNHLFGYSVAVSGRVLVVGAPTRLLHNLNTATGVAVVYNERRGWHHSDFLTQESGGWSYGFGRSVGVDKERVIVGAPKRQEENQNGLAEIYVLTKTGWLLENVIESADMTGYDRRLGEAVGISEEMAYAFSPFYFYPTNRGCMSHFNLRGFDGLWHAYVSPPIECEKVLSMDRDHLLAPWSSGLYVYRPFDTYWSVVAELPGNVNWKDISLFGSEAFTIREGPLALVFKFDFDEVSFQALPDPSASSTGEAVQFDSIHAKNGYVAIVGKVPPTGPIVQAQVIWIYRKSEGGYQEVARVELSTLPNRYGIRTRDISQAFAFEWPYVVIGAPDAATEDYGAPVGAVLVYNADPAIFHDGFE